MTRPTPTAAAFTPQPPRLRVHCYFDGITLDLEFTGSFKIGRGDDCELCVKNQHVSRRHAELQCEAGRWYLTDLQSANGLFINGKRVTGAAVEKALTFRLGVAGPEVTLETVEPPPAKPPVALLPQQAAAEPGDKTILGHYINHYFNPPKDGAPVSDQTVFLRRAAQQIQTKQRRQYQWVVAVLVVVALVAVAYAMRVRMQLQEQLATAQGLFYSIKAIDVSIAKVQIAASATGIGGAEIEAQRMRRRELEQDYDRFLGTLKVYDPKLTEKQKLILRVARIFGECELNMPKQFETEIDNYIGRWRQTGRLADGIRKAKARGYTKTISDELLANGLPPQFLYLVLQESGFDEYASGPETYKGIAKGAWQFIPETALKYGLHLGPLVDQRRPDPGDDRHHFDRETKAAVRYLKDLYCTDAQASGLLVLASYNWGEGRVLPLIRSMPANPRERNFWQLLTKYRDKIPQETYDYVFYIASAAVIGEDPKRFGFDFDKPLGALESQ